jgi:TRAP-type uncharacterized transport system substrate-binding protein
LTREQIEAWGGGLRRMSGPTANAGYQRVVDAIIRNLFLASTPGARCWIDASVLLNLRFLNLPDDLIESLCKELGGEPGFVPHGYLRGVDHDVRTVSYPHLLIYARLDSPDELVRDVAEQLDRQRALFRESHVNMAYDPESVAARCPIPLHPAAEAYYRERGFPLPA